MDSAALCDTYVEVKLALVDAIWLFLVLTYPFLPLHGYHRSASGIINTSKNFPEWGAIQLVIHSIVGE